MTTVADKAAEKEAKAEALKARKAELEAREAKANEGRTGKGTRIAIDLTKGRNPQPVEYEAFDTSKADTLPTSIDEFMALTNVKEEPKLLGFLIDGFNSSQYEIATDPTAEYVEASWPEPIQKQFRITVKNYADATGVSVEDAVTLIKPGFVAAQAKAATVSA